MGRQECAADERADSLAQVIRAAQPGAEYAGPAIAGSGLVGRSGGSPTRHSGRRFFPHFAPSVLTCRFATQEAIDAADSGLTVEECGVQWSAVE